LAKGDASMCSHDDDPRFALGNDSFRVASPVATIVRFFGGTGVGLSVGMGDDGEDEGR